MLDLFDNYILHRISNHLPNPKDRLRLSIVNKKIRENIKESKLFKAERRILKPDYNELIGRSGDEYKHCKLFINRMSTQELKTEWSEYLIMSILNEYTLPPEQAYTLFKYYKFPNSLGKWLCYCDSMPLQPTRPFGIRRMNLFKKCLPLMTDLDLAQGAGQCLKYGNLEMLKFILEQGLNWEKMFTTGVIEDFWHDFIKSPPTAYVVIKFFIEKLELSFEEFVEQNPRSGTKASLLEYRKIKEGLPSENPDLIDYLFYPYHHLMNVLYEQTA